MGRATVSAKIENVGDLFLANRGDISDDEVRTAIVEHAPVDTGATGLSLPPTIIQQLGLQECVDKEVRTSAGARTAAMYDAVRLTIMDRYCTMDVVEVPDDTPTLIGQIPLAALDFVVDPRGQKLIGNPAHDGEHVFEMY